MVNVPTTWWPVEVAGRCLPRRCSPAESVISFESKIRVFGHSKIHEWIIFGWMSWDFFSDSKSRWMTLPRWWSSSPEPRCTKLGSGGSRNKGRTSEESCAWNYESWHYFSQPQRWSPAAPAARVETRLVEAIIFLTGENGFSAAAVHKTF